MADDAPPASFEAYIDSVLGTSEATPAAAAPVVPEVAAPAVAPAAVPAAVAPAAEPAAPAAPFKVPDALAAKITGTAPAAPVAAASEDAEKSLDDLFKTNAGQAFSTIKAERKALAAEAATLRAEVEALKKAGPPSAELDALKQQAEASRVATEAYEREIALIKVEASNEYKNTVGKAFTEVKTEADALATKYKADARGIFAALQETDTTKQDELLGDIASNFSERDRVKLYGLIDKFAAVSAQDQQVRAKSKEALALIEGRKTQEDQQTRERYAAEYNQALSATAAEMQKNFPFFSPLEGQPDWNATVSDMFKFASEVDVDKLSVRDRAQLVQQGVALPLLAEVVKFYAADAAAAKAQLARYEQGTPGAGGGSPGAAAPASTIPPEVGFLEALEAAAARAA